MKVQKVKGTHQSQHRYWECSPTLQASKIVNQDEIQHLVVHAEGNDLVCNTRFHLQTLQPFVATGFAVSLQVGSLAAETPWLS